MIHITSRRKEGSLAAAENWMDVGAGESNGRGVGVRVGG